MFIGLQYWILKRLFHGASRFCSGAVYAGRSKLAILMGNDFFARIAGKVVIDFGCGEGDEAVEMAARGARLVIGIDIREDLLKIARQKAARNSVQHSCLFVHSTNERAEVIVSVDAFEHFANPAAILETMNALLQPAGEVLISFGPTWYHPLGGHLFSVFPWAHLIFSEEALIRWRATFKTDGATRFGEVEGGLNQITIGNFEALVANSSLQLDSLELVPIKWFRLFHNRATREFTTALVRCRLIKRRIMRKDFGDSGNVHNHPVPDTTV